MRKKLDLILKSKKADMVIDSVTVVITLIVLGLLTILIYPVVQDFNTTVQSEDKLNTQAKTSINNMTELYPSLFDGIYVFVFVLLMIVVLVTAFFIDANPVFFVISIIFMLAVFLVGALLSNAHIELMQSASLTGLIASFPKTHWIMSNLPIVILFQFILSGIVIYAKTRQ